MPFEVRDARQLQGVVPGALVDFALVITKDAGYATNLRVRRYETRGAGSADGAPAGAAAASDRARAAAGRARPAGPGLHAHGLDARAQ